MHENQEKKQALMEHLVALRNTLLISAGTVLVALIVIFAFAVNPLMECIEAPLVKRGISVIFTKGSEALMAKIKISLIAAIVVSYPVLTLYVWRLNMSINKFKNELEGDKDKKKDMEKEPEQEQKSEE